MPSFEFGRKDLYIIAGLLLTALIVFCAQEWFHRVGTSNKIYAEIILDNIVVERISLSENRSFSLEKLPGVMFEVKDQKIAFVQSDCPDKVCVNTGWLEISGEFAACLPNKVVLRIVEETDGGIDAVAR